MFDASMTLKAEAVGPMDLNDTSSELAVRVAVVSESSDAKMFGTDGFKGLIVVPVIENEHKCLEINFGTHLEVEDQNGSYINSIKTNGLDREFFELLRSAAQQSLYDYLDDLDELDKEAS